jgi:hypothetical protein
MDQNMRDTTMHDDTVKFGEALRNLIRRADDPRPNIEQAAVKAIQQRLLLRACATLIDDCEYERGRFIESFAKAIPAPQEPPEQWPRIIRQNHPGHPGHPGEPQRDPQWSEDEYAIIDRLARAAG